jgi:hypothetical protein
MKVDEMVLQGSCCCGDAIAMNPMCLVFLFYRPMIIVVFINFKTIGKKSLTHKMNMFFYPQIQ